MCISAHLVLSHTHAYIARHSWLSTHINTIRPDRCRLSQSAALAEIPKIVGILSCRSKIIWVINMFVRFGMKYRRISLLPCNCRILSMFTAPQQLLLTHTHAHSVALVSSAHVCAFNGLVRREKATARQFRFIYSFFAYSFFSGKFLLVHTLLCSTFTSGKEQTMGFRDPTCLRPKWDIRAREGSTHINESAGSRHRYWCCQMETMMIDTYVDIILLLKTMEFFVWMF